MNAARPVYIKHIAHVSALGLSAAEATESLLAGKKNLSEYQLLGESWPWFALPLAEENWTARTRHALGLLVAELAAGTPKGSLDGFPRFIGSSANGMGEIETIFRTAGPDAPFSDDAAILDREIQLAFGSKVASWIFSTACTSGMAALEAAFTLIAQGEIDEALVLGIDFGCNTTLAGFASLGLLARTGNGLILGEAAAGLLLTAQPGPGWRIAACRLCIDGYSPTMPTPDGRVIADNIAAALDQAKFPAHTIDLVKPHRSGLPGIDEAENAALDLVFTSRRPAEISFKHQMGHTLGACGPAEITTLLALLGTPAWQARQPHRLLFNFVGFGGSTAALVTERSPAPEACS
ncbi:MAG: hypothetical protein LBE22_01190 [Azoarcus sp.]|jgi:3-oxoacyl-[acyl-carrier-protein] synthase-1|nr:hypothetical protein [Azoarcus sp.]